MLPTNIGMIIYQNDTTKSLIPSIISVSIGSLASGPPMSLMVLPMTGIMKIIRMKNAIIVIIKSTIGYVMAPLIFFFIDEFFSCCRARRFKISSKIPPVSPAATMFT